jgi:catechol 2,3-dioxygenase-like lactoylglutathione lyase family enzyme
LQFVQVLEYALLLPGYKYCNTFTTDCSYIMPVTALNHYNLRAPRDLLDKLRAFYCDVVGLKQGARPPFDSFGYWLNADGQAILHLSEARPGEHRAAGAVNTFDHVAFSCTARREMEAQLAHCGVEYRTAEVPLTTQVQLFFHDPAGNGIELNFADETDAMPESDPAGESRREAVENKRCTVKYGNLREAFEFASMDGDLDGAAYICLDTGAVYLSSSGMDDSVDLPDDLETSDRYVSAPGKHELNLGRRLAMEFADRVMPDHYRAIEDIFRRKGAYSRFKDFLDLRDALEKWYQFEEEEIERALREWCEVNEIRVEPEGR